MNLKTPSADRRDDEAAAWATRLDGGPLPATAQASLDAWLAQDPAHAWRLGHYQRFYAELHGTMPTQPCAPRFLARDGARTARHRRGWLGGLAAGLAAAAVLGFWLFRPLVVETTVAQRHAEMLADGSRVELNAQTKLLVSRRGSDRHVTLERGEALFSVRRDPAHPFVVSTPAGTVRVTGTVFNVRTGEDGSLEVTVLEGSVAVRPGTSAGDDGRRLARGEQLTFEPAAGRLDVRRLASVDDVVAWRDGKLVFDDAPLGAALDRVARYHGRRVKLAPAAAALRLGGRYTLDDFEGFLASLEKTLPVRIERLADDTVQVSAAAPR